MRAGGNAMPWKPICRGSLRQQLFESVQDIARGLRESEADLEDVSYSGGKSGVALFFAYLASACGDAEAAACSARLMEQALETAGESVRTVGFFGGLSGIGWSYRHIHQLLHGRPAAEDVTADLDDLIAELVAVGPWPWEYDLIYGLAGIGAYALDHPNRAWRESVIGKILDRLEESAQRFDHGIAWLNRPELMVEVDAERYPQGRFDMGLAHGTAGVVGFLGQICKAGGFGDRARAMLSDAIAWLLSSRRPEGGGSVFPVFFGELASCRSAWCYGDPGTAAALFRAGEGARGSAWESAALDIARRDCFRPFEDCGVVDAGLCHGSAGLAHLYARFFQATGERVFLAAATRWLRETLAMRQAGEGLGGYSSWWPLAGEWRTAPGLLTGVAGIGLALIAATTSVEPGWDRPLLLS